MKHENFIKKFFLNNLGITKKIDENKNLISSGIIDSMSIIILISLIEKEYKTKINLKKFDINQISSINKIKKYLRKI